ncbi:MAG: Fmu (Sun) domain-containing protein [Bacteroidetes bacterium]|nr:Fmu (Sun) domain-containing protein [Bacteroidota bacterium]
MQNRFTTYFNVAQKNITLYKGDIPLSAYLKNYFASNKKHGSTDRKQITHWCYCYYRLGKALINISIDERMKVAFFLCNQHAKNYEHLFKENWIANWSENIDDRIQFIKTIYTDFDVVNIFETHHHIAFDIDKTAFIKAHLQQPNLFLRIRPTHNQTVKNKLNNQSILFKQQSEDCLSLANTTKVESVVDINREVIVQDYSSQQVGELMQIVKDNLIQPIALWDCCAASGGKTILAKDIIQSLSITVSDVRASIISNLRKRFEEAGVRAYQSFIIDATKPITTFNKKFNFIICDVPCTGSGTWARTPEELYFFKEENIAVFQELQKQIALNTIQHLIVGGYFLYITCSVFSAENDDVLEKIMQQNNVELVEKKYFKGYTTQADTMFAALLKKVS